MILFITNREIVTVKGKEQVRVDGGDNAGDNLRFGEYTPPVAPARKGVFELFPEPEKYSELDYGAINPNILKDEKGSARFFGELYHALKKEGDALFFIHGFNTDLPNLEETIANLQKCYIKEGSPIKHLILFTWPSRHPLLPLHYADDEKDAKRSGEALARAARASMRFIKEFLAITQREACGKNIHLMAHSMGSRVLKHVLKELKQNSRQGIPAIFKEMILIASDVEHDVFEHEFDSLIDLGRRIHIYFHEWDEVLNISKQTKTNSNRLGVYGRKKREDSLIDVIDVDVSNCSDDPTSSLLTKFANHWYYYSSKDVVEVFNGKKEEGSKRTL